ncbi:MAG: OmpA family protein [Bdellovibrionales bacterium]|nr:OmpA family protein [Bdellovibrionales bacterium]
MKAIVFVLMMSMPLSGFAATLIESLPSESSFASQPEGLWYLGEVGLGAYHFSTDILNDSGLQEQLGVGAAYYTSQWMHQGFFGIHRFENLDTNNWEYLTRIKLDWTSGYKITPYWQVGPTLSLILNTGVELNSNSDMSPFIGAAATRDFLEGEILYKLMIKGLISTNVDGAAFLTFVGLQIGFGPTPSQAPAQYASRPMVESRSDIEEEHFDIKQIAKGEYRINLKTVEFDLGKSTLDRQDQGTIKKIASALSKNPEAFTEITVKGHTDSIGSYKINKKLSKKRADRLKVYLVNAGVSPSVISTSGRADLEPKSAKIIARINRRAEMIVKSPLSENDLKLLLVRSIN